MSVGNATDLSVVATAKVEPHLDEISNLARSQFVFLLQLAYSGELGAALAYVGHAHSLRTRNKKECAEILQIAREEIVHRHCILQMLHELGSAPVPRREKKLSRIGWCISVFCHIGGWFFPMYGAARLEAQNIQEYELAARLALWAGHAHFVDRILEMAEIEWDHELYFRNHAQRHFLWKLMPHWPVPEPRNTIRLRFAEQGKLLPETLFPIKVPWFIR